MNIVGKITGIKYEVFSADKLAEYNIEDVDINDTPSSFLLNVRDSRYAISKWVSPKRTRSYPFERVYNTLNVCKKITIIPVIKDEGAKGDRDFIQWDTISLMSLLDVYVIFAYYNDATARGNKITNQKFDTDYILSKIVDIQQYHSSALHWNLNEVHIDNFTSLVERAKAEYSSIESRLGVKMHGESGIDSFIMRINSDVDAFKEFSRSKAQKAQIREVNTIQPKEVLLTASKAKVTITNYLGGKYYITVDETELRGDCLHMIEGKHSKNSLLPSNGDIKDGLIKMILYSNLEAVEVDDVPVNVDAKLLLTSSKLIGELRSTSSMLERAEYLRINNMSTKQRSLIDKLCKEAEINGFEVIIKQV